MALAPGSRLGPYEVTALIGSGGVPSPDKGVDATPPPGKLQMPRGVTDKGST